MTASGDFIPQDPEFEVAPNYPTAFGITFTPTVSGIACGIVGVGAAIFLWITFVQPALDQYNQLKDQVEQKKAQLLEQERVEKQLKDAKARLVQVGKQREDVMALFATQNDLDTVLIDLNKLIETNNAGLLAARQAKLATCPAWVRAQYTSIASAQSFEEQNGPLVAEAKLKKFQPVDLAQATQGKPVPVPGVINDGSYGEALNNKLKRQTINVEFEGNFNQTQSIFRAIERLQPLLIVHNLDVKLGGNNSGTVGKRLFESGPGETIRFLTNCQPDSLVTTTFQMDALLPLTPEEMKQVAAPPNPPAKK